MRAGRIPWLLVSVWLGLGSLPTPGRAETIHLDTGQLVRGEVLKETEEQVFLDLGFTVLPIPKKRIAQRDVSPRGVGEATTDSEAGETVEADSTVVSEESVFFSRQGTRAPIKKHAERFGDSVVRITTPSGLGSGFVIHSKEGYIVTNHHVVEREQKITVTFFVKRGREFQKIVKEKVRIVALNPLFDLALLRIEDMGDLGVPEVYLSEVDDDLKVGDPVFAIGNPLGLERSVSEGIVSKTDREFEGLLYVQTTAAINPGNSGGPLFDDRGDVVGIINMKATFGEGLGFAVPLTVLKYFLKHRAAFAYDKDNPNNGFRYLPPPRRDEPPKEERRL